MVCYSRGKTFSSLLKEERRALTFSCGTKLSRVRVLRFSVTSLKFSTGKISTVLTAAVDIFVSIESFRNLLNDTTAVYSKLTSTAQKPF